MISLLCPTRRRPDNMRRFCESVYATAANADEVQVIFYIDEDDRQSEATAQELDVVWEMGPRLVLSESWNALARHPEAGEILGHMGDDIVFQTPGWDVWIKRAFEQYPDRICFVHGRDGIHDEALGTHGFLHRRWVDTLGYFVPPYFSHDYNDTWLTEVADMIGRRVYLPEVMTEHFHPDVGRAVYDQTYQEHADAGRRQNVSALYASLLGERQSDAAKLREAMEGS